MSDSPFFSIIIPAHNEERYIEATLRSLLALEYPQERFEIIVVENGSTDKTAEIARSVLAARGAVLSFPQKGVAFARNRGLEAAKADGDWVVFLDADTHLRPSFLSTLAASVKQLTPDAVIGTAAVEPAPATPYARAWFVVLNFFHHLLEQVYAIIIVRRSALGGFRFNEGLSWMEDVHFTDALKLRGTFFFMTATLASTSTRRYRKDGWWRLLFWNLYVGVLPESLQRRFAYAPVR